MPSNLSCETLVPEQPASSPPLSNAVTAASRQQEQAANDDQHTNLGSTSSLPQPRRHRRQRPLQLPTARRHLHQVGSGVVPAGGGKGALAHARHVCVRLTWAAVKTVAPLTARCHHAFHTVYLYQPEGLHLPRSTRASPCMTDRAACRPHCTAVFTKHACVYGAPVHEGPLRLGLLLADLIHHPPAGRQGPCAQTLVAAAVSCMLRC